MKPFLFVLVLLITGCGLLLFKLNSLEGKIEANNEFIVESRPLPTRVPPLDPEQLFRLVNDWRTFNGKKPYVKNSDLCRVAEARSIQIVSDWSHDQFIPTARKLLPSYQSIGENLGRNSPSENELVLGWVKSPSHLENLEKDFKETCIVVNNEFVVQIFANL